MNQDTKSYETAISTFQSLVSNKKPEHLWRLGEALSIIKNSNEYEQYFIWSYFIEQEGKDKYKCFYSFLVSDDFQLNGEKIVFSISEKTTNRYMKIYELFSLDVLKLMPYILAEHLYDLIEVDELTRLSVLEAFREVEKEYDKSLSSKQKTLKLQRLYRKDDVKQILNIRKLKNRHLTAPEIKKVIFDDMITPRISPVLKRSTEEKYEWGIKNLNTNHFEQLKDLHPKEPIDEQSLVGLFCTMFHLIKDKVFRLPHKQGNYKFSKIIYTRSPFPDARIEIEIYNEELEKTGDDKLNVEFEYKSYTYKSPHRHHLEPNATECNLIICWENNWKDPFYYLPIVSIKDLLETGEINVIYFDKTD